MALQPGTRLGWGTTAFFVAPYDVHPEGDRFVFFQAAGDAASSVGREEIHVVLSWFEELKARVPVR
jgi:hypothetical protein